MELLAAACVAAVRAGSTRVPTDGRLASALAAVGGHESLHAVKSVLERARARDPHVAVIVGSPGERTPLVLDGAWIYVERMRALEERFSERVRERIGRAVPEDARRVTRALKAVTDGPPALTDEQRRAVRTALTSGLALVTGGPGTGKTTIVVALLRALWWMGTPMHAVAIAAPTGKAAQRLKQAIATGLAQTAGDMSEAGLASIAPEPQTIHRLLGWSPSRSRFARHENDPLPHRVVLVDEASMVDLQAMDRLVRAMPAHARLVLLGDADQLPSVEAGAVFRDLCAGLGAARLTTNLRVARDPSGQRIVDAAAAVNAGHAGVRFGPAVIQRQRVDELAFEGVEHLAAPWSRVGDALLDRWWTTRIAAGDFERRASRVFRSREGQIVPNDAVELRALFEHNARFRILCATRVRGFASGADALNEGLLARMRGGVRARRWGKVELAPGTPVVFERNDYERQLFNGDQGLVVRLASDEGEGESLAAVFARGDGFVALPLDAVPDLSPSFAMTVHKAQGSEFDHVALVLPDADLPLLTRELVYTAITRARRSVTIVGDPELLARAVSRVIDRHCGVAERLAKPTK
jgi:exodeoxyribonuclease V alpha subunit